MSTTLSTNTAETTKYRTTLFLTLIAAGLAGNYFNFPIFLNINFLFGSIFAMLALQFFGLGRGIVAAAAIAGYTYFLWNHPYAIIIMTTEVAAVGWLMSRRKVGMVLADTLYWLIIGMPLVYLFYHLVMHVPFSNTTIVMSKQAINGIANALVARLLFTGYTLRSCSSRTSYREIIYNLLAFFVLCPALILLAVGSRTDFSETDRHIRTTLMQESRRVTDRVETWVVNRKSAIINLAEMAASLSPQQIQPYLEQTKKSDVNFKRIGLLDKEATIIAYFPLLDELGQKNIGKNFADRPYIPTLKRTLKPMLSEVVMGRIGIPKPMVTMLAPVVIGGEYNGYVTGILSLEQIWQHLDKSTDINATLFTLLDKNDNVIMTNRTDQTVMTPFVRGKGVLTPLEKGLSQWVPILPANTPPTERWQKSFYIEETSIGDLAEWKLILEQPVAPFQKTLYDNFTGKLSLLFLILLGALALAELLSHRIVVTLEKLRMITHDLPLRLATESKEIVWPESRIQEANHLINNFKRMGDTLSEQFNEIREINESLEQRVEERTRELRESEEKFRTVADYTYGWEVWEDSKGYCLYCSPFCERVTGYSPEAFKADAGLLERLIHPEDLPRWKAHHASVHYEPKTQAALDESANELEFRILHRNGEVRWLNHLCYHVYDLEGHDLGHRISNRDITEHKRLEAEVVKNRNLEALGILAGGIAHDFNNLLQGLLGNLELAKMNTEESSKAFPYLETAGQLYGTATKLTGQLIAFSPGGNLLPINIQPASHLKEEVVSTLEGSDLVVEFDLAEDLWPITVDPSQFRNVIKHLVLNAREAMPKESGGTLTIKAVNESLPEHHGKHPTLPPGSYVKISIQDHGCGISKENLPRIFDPYFSTKQLGSQKGMGLGLTLCEAIIKKHGGVITVESELGHGTTFHLYLPAVAKEGGSE
ncbi:MAG: ATP-binding protein [Deltaproteobacteria bacterium]|nr:ATP-binding protein [Deltaproteobacteria bacterium]